jgi:hypothetical protein
MGSFNNQDESRNKQEAKDEREEEGKKKRKMEARETDGSCRSPSKYRPTGRTAKEDFIQSDRTK